jgi:hypothetical protein
MIMFPAPVETAHATTTTMVGADTLKESTMAIVESRPPIALDMPLLNHMPRIIVMQRSKPLRDTANTPAKEMAMGDQENPTLPLP